MDRRSQPAKRKHSVIISMAGQGQAHLMAGNRDMAEQTPRRLEELPQDTRDWLADLRPDELKTLQAVVELPADDVRQAFKMVHDLQTVGRFTKWLVITFIGIFLGTVVLYENIIKVIGYIRGGPAQ